METFFLPEGCGLGTNFMLRPKTTLIVKSDDRKKMTEFMRHAAGIYPPNDVEREQFTLVDEKKKCKVFYKPKNVRINFDGTVQEFMQSQGLEINFKDFNGRRRCNCLRDMKKYASWSKSRHAALIICQKNLLRFETSELTEKTRVDSLNMFQLAVLGFILCIFKHAHCDDGGALIIDGVEDLFRGDGFEEQVAFVCAISWYCDDHCIPCIISTTSNEIYESLRRQINSWDSCYHFVNLDEQIVVNRREGAICSTLL